MQNKHTDFALSRDNKRKGMVEDWKREIWNASRMTPNEMRARAVECDELARQGSDSAANKMFTKAAQEWRELADQIDNFRSSSKG